jgi:hypothetical protein
VDGLYVVSNSDGVIYKISRRPGMRSGLQRRYAE